MIRWFGTTVTETTHALRRVHLGESGGQPPDSNDKMSAIVRIVLSLVLLVFGIYLVASGNEGQLNTGTTLLGALTGYWLK